MIDQYVTTALEQAAASNDSTWYVIAVLAGLLIIGLVGIYFIGKFLAKLIDRLASEIFTIWKDENARRREHEARLEKAFAEVAAQTEAVDDAVHHLSERLTRVEARLEARDGAG